MGDANDGKAVLLTGDIAPMLRRLVVPLIFGYAAGMANSLVDLFYLGRLSTEALAIYAFNLPVTMTIVYLAAAIGIGVTTVLANALGANDRETARYAPLSALLVSAISVGAVVAGILILYGPIAAFLGVDEALRQTSRRFISVWIMGEAFLAVLMTVNACLTAYGDTRTPSALIVAGAAFRLAFEPALIFGFGPIPAMGLMGAALCNVIVWVVMASIAFRLAFYSKRPIRAALPPSFAAMKRIWSKIVRIGAPTVASVMTVPLSLAALTAILSSHGATAVAAFGVAARIEAVALVFVQALSYGGAPLIGQNFGAGLLSRIRATLAEMQKWLGVWAVGIALFFALAGRTLAAAFSADGEVIGLAAFYFTAVPFSFFFYGIFHGAGSLFTTVRQPSLCLYLTVGRNVLLMIPAAYALGSLYGVWGVFASVALTNCLIGLIGAAAVWAALPAIARPQAERVSAPAAIELRGK